jgi:hypothetical protein
MKSRWIAWTALAALTAGWADQSGSSSNQSSPQSSPASTAQATLHPDASAPLGRGTGLVVELNKSISVKKAKNGDPVKATVIQDVVYHGKLVVRRGSKLLGHVSETKIRTGEDRESRLGVVFDRVVLKGGGEIRFNAEVRALAPAVRSSLLDKPDLMAPPMPGPGGSGGSVAQPMGGMSSSSPRSSTIISPTDPPVADRADIHSHLPMGEPPVPEGGYLSIGSRGVYGIPGLALSGEHTGTSGPVITSTSKNVNLDGGTQILVEVNDLVQQ